MLKCGYAAALLIALLQFLLTGCPAAEDDPAAATGGDGFNPLQPLPTAGKLLNYDKLRLGMTTVDLAQVYNAPEGRGDGFARVIAPYDAVVQHYINFDAPAGEPQRKLICAFYRDRLYWIIERRDGITAQQAQAWQAQCVADYGAATAETIPGAQWMWSEDGVELTFTQDNASDNYMSANVVVVHEPTQAAARAYLAAREKDTAGGGTAAP
jgi:hypothetical protein